MSSPGGRATRGHPPALHLPRRPRMSNIDGSETGSTRPFCWDAELVAGLRNLIRREGVTIYMALLAVCAAVLRAHTGQGDIVLGSPTGTRERPEFET